MSRKNPSGDVKVAIENGPVEIVDLPSPNGDFPVRKLLVYQRGNLVGQMDRIFGRDATSRHFSGGNVWREDIVRVLTNPNFSW